MLRKKTLLVISLIGTILFIGAFFVESLEFCYLGNVNCISILDLMGEVTLPLVFVFLFSVATYNLQQNIYTRWFKFVRWWIPLSVAIILLLPEYSHDWMFKIEKDSATFLMSGIFVLASLIIIIASYIKSRKAAR